MRTISLRTRLAAAAVAVPLSVLGLAACNGDDTSTAASETSTSASASGDASSAAPVETADLQAGDSIDADQFAALMTAAYDQATTAKMTMTMTAGGQDIDVTGLADYRSQPISMQMQMSGVGSGVGDMEMLMVDNVMYMKIPGLSDKYLKTDLSDPSNPLGSTFTDSFDPEAMAKVIGAGLKEASYVGEEDVDGETLDHYRATVDSSAMLAQLDDDSAKAAAGQLPKELTYDLWFDSEGRYRQMDMDLGGAMGAMSMKFSDWGTDVDIEAPPASEVTDMSDAFGGSAG